MMIFQGEYYFHSSPTANWQAFVDAHSMEYFVFGLVFALTAWAFTYGFNRLYLLIKTVVNP